MRSRIPSSGRTESSSATIMSVGTARAQYFPSVRLSAGYDWFNQDFGLTGGRTGWSVRLGLSYPLFNGFQREEGVVRARTQAEVGAPRLSVRGRGG